MGHFIGKIAGKFETGYRPMNVEDVLKLARERHLLHPGTFLGQTGGRPFQEVDRGGLPGVTTGRCGRTRCAGGPQGPWAVARASLPVTRRDTGRCRRYSGPSAPAYRTTPPPL